MAKAIIVTTHITGINSSALRHSHEAAFVSHLFIGQEEHLLLHHAVQVASPDTEKGEKPLCERSAVNAFESALLEPSVRGIVVPSLETRVVDSDTKVTLAIVIYAIPEWETSFRPADWRDDTNWPEFMLLSKVEAIICALATLATSIVEDTRKAAYESCDRVLRFKRRVLTS